MSDPREYTISLRKLQHIYDRHATDFEVKGPKNAGRLTEMEVNIYAHLTHPGTGTVYGFYRGDPASLHYNSETENLVVVDQSNNVVAAFRLSKTQAAYVRSTGRLN